MESVNFITDGSLLEWLFKLYDRKVYNDREMGSLLGIDFKTGDLREGSLLDNLFPEPFFEAITLLLDRGMINKKIARKKFEDTLLKYKER